MPETMNILLRIIIACILGGLIGMERESINRPAGFRTHILVCVGSALVMIVGIYLVEEYQHITDSDPARLGAQVISGIGFLGAGTILREGLTVKGLTTAASLWTTACIGLATGSGYLVVAIFSAFLVLLILIFFSRFEKYVSRKHNEITIKIKTINRPGQIGKIGTNLGSLNISITNISLTPTDDSDIYVLLTLKIPRGVDHPLILDTLSNVDGVKSTEIID